eukprot:403334722
MHSQQQIRKMEKTIIKERELEDENKKMYSKLMSILNTSNLKLRKQIGPTSLNISQRRNIINQINQENDEFVRKLETIQPTVPNKKVIDKNTEKIDYYKNIASLYQNGGKRLDPLIEKQMKSILSSAKLNKSSRVTSQTSLNTSLPSIIPRGKEQKLELENILNNNSFLMDQQNSPRSPSTKNLGQLLNTQDSQSPTLRMDYSSTMIFDNNNHHILMSKRPSKHQLLLSNNPSQLLSHKRSLSVQRSNQASTANMSSLITIKMQSNKNSKIFPPNINHRNGQSLGQPAVLHYNPDNDRKLSKFQDKKDQEQVRIMLNDLSQQSIDLIENQRKIRELNHTGFTKVEVVKKIKMKPMEYLSKVQQEIDEQNQ